MVQGVGCMVWGTGCMVQDAGCRVQGAGYLHHLERLVEVEEGRAVAHLLPGR
jgi:hypothetical protein